MPVESTRSQNITVMCLRSPVASARAWQSSPQSAARTLAQQRAARCRGLLSRAAFCADAPRTTPNLLEVLIGQVGKDREINAVLSKALGVLGHAEFFEPVRNLLHCAASLRWSLRRTTRRYPTDAPR